MSYSRDKHLNVYADGCCRNNGRRDARAGVGVYFGEGNPRNVSERLEGRATNQRAEINAAIKALENAPQRNQDVRIKTDSEYVVKAMTDWRHTWERNGFRNYNGAEVANKQDFERLIDLTEQRRDVQWEHVPGHSGVRGNEMADRYAKDAADKH